MKTDFRCRNRGGFSQYETLLGLALLMSCIFWFLGGFQTWNQEATKLDQRARGPKAASFPSELLKVEQECIRFHRRRLEQMDESGPSPERLARRICLDEVFGRDEASPKSRWNRSWIW